MRQWILAVIVLTSAAAAAVADDWPQFRGINRDGISAETGLLKSWPEGEPKRLWQAEIGQGFSSVAVVDNTVYATGFVGDDLMVTALDASGKQLWRQRVDKAGGGAGKKGARGTTTIDGDRLYLLTEDGNLVCLKTADGAKVWSKNILSEYGAKNIQWRLAESLLIDGDRVICAPGGRASLVALDKKTGNEVWAVEPVDPKTNYASAVIIETGGLRQIVSFAQKSVFGASADTGKLLWKHPHTTSYDVNATSVVFKDGMIFVTSGYGTGSEGLKLSVSDGKASVSQAWTNKELDDHFGGVVLLDGKVYGTAFRGGLACIDLASGNTVYKKREVKKSSNIYADGKLYCQGHDGTVQLVNPGDGSVVSSFSIEVKQKNMMWAHPAISAGRLYIHHDETLSVYDIKAK